MHHSSFNIRQAAPQDAPQIETLYRLLVPGSPVSVLPERLAALHASTEAYALVGESDGLVLGTVFLCLCPDPMYGTQPFGVIENVVVLNSARGSGIGSALLRHVEQLALQADCSKLMVSSSAARVEAHRFFRRSGFSPGKVGFVKYRRAFGAAPAEA